MYLYVPYSFYIADDVALSMKRSNKFFNMLIKEYRLRPFILNNSHYLYYNRVQGFVKYAYFEKNIQISSAM